jgi:hypothetical protein
MENYTFVELGGEKHPIKFGFNALRKYSMKTGTTLNELNKLGADMNLNDALILIHCGIEDGYRAAKQKCELKLTDLIEFEWDKKEDVDFEKLKNKAEYIKKLEEYGK